MRKTTYQIQLALMFILVGMLLVVIIDATYGQTLTTQQTTPTPIPPTTPTIAANPSPGGTPTVATQEPIATTEDLAAQFNTLLATSGTGIVGGVGALWAIIRKKTSKIDNALRGADFDTRDLLEIINSVFEHAKKNPDKSLGAILEMPAYKDRILTNTTIAVAWDKDYNEYDEWFTSRYVMNKT